MRAKTRAFLLGSGGHAQMLLALTREFSGTCLFAGADKAAIAVDIAACLEAESYTGPQTCEALGGLPVFAQTEAGLADLKAQGFTHFLFALGSVKAAPQRWGVFQSLCEQGFQPLTLIHPHATVAESAKVGAGCFIGARAVIQPLAKVGQAAIINTGAIVEHHAMLGENVHVAPAAVLCGNVSVGKNSMIGANSTVIQGVTIGESVTVGAGSVVLKAVADGETVLGC